MLIVTRLILPTVMTQLAAREATFTILENLMHITAGEAIPTGNAMMILVDTNRYLVP